MGDVAYHLSVVSSLPLAYIPLFSVAGSIGFLALCYVLAATAGHSRVLLPMISDCFRRAPESYIAGWGMGSFACVGLLLGVLAMAGYLNRFEAASAADRRLRACSAWLGLLGCSGFVGATIVTERDNNLLHNVAAVLGFFAYFLHGVTLTAALYRCRGSGAATRTSLACKAGCIALGALASGAYGALVANGALDRRVGGVDGDRAVAFCEWVSVLTIAFFNLTFRLDFGEDLRLSDVWPAVAGGLCGRRAPGLDTEKLLLPEQPA